MAVGLRRVWFGAGLALALVAVGDAAAAGWPDTHPLPGGWSSSVGNHRFAITIDAIPPVSATLF